MKNATRRKEQIALCYVVASGGRLPENLGNLLRAIREVIPDVTESDLRDAITWAIRRTKRKAALIERMLRNEPAALGASATGRRNTSLREFQSHRG
jgi:hypothetical protein